MEKINYSKHIPILVKKEKKKKKNKLGNHIQALLNLKPNIFPHNSASQSDILQHS